MIPRFYRLIFLMALLAGCGTPAQQESSKQVVLVSILPQTTFVNKIAGDDFKISLLIPHGANPTTYSLLPAQMAEIASAKVWLRMGHVGFERSWADKIREVNGLMEEVDLSEGLDLMGGRIVDGRLTAVDPHTWLSPVAVKVMAGSILDRLIQLNPAASQQYKEGYSAFVKEIEETDAILRSLLAPHVGKKFISFHPSLSYFARDYGLIQLSIQQGGREPSPSHIAKLIDIARAENIRTIYIQSEFDREQARMLAQEIGGDIVQVWPLNPDWSSNLIDLARVLSENF